MWMHPPAAKLKRLYHADYYDRCYHSVVRTSSQSVTLVNPAKADGWQHLTRTFRVASSKTAPDKGSRHQEEEEI